MGSKRPLEIIDAEFEVVSESIREDIRNADRVRIGGSKGAAKSRTALLALAGFAVGVGILTTTAAVTTPQISKIEYSNAAIPGALEQVLKDMGQKGAPIVPKAKPAEKDDGQAAIARRAMEQTAKQLQDAFAGVGTPDLKKQKAAATIGIEMLKTYRQHLDQQERKQNAPKPK